MLDFETDMLPSNICENCLGENRVSFDLNSGRRLCIECEPNPVLDEPDEIDASAYDPSSILKDTLIGWEPI